MKLIPIFLLFITWASVGESKKYNDINMADGRTVNNCTDYNLARNDVSLDESNDNMIVSAEYLACAYDFSIDSLVRQDEIIDKLYAEFDVSKLPLSISQSVTAKATFKSLNWKLDKHGLKIEYSNNDVNIVISLERKTKNGYLIFIADEILSGTYKSYFPAELIVTNDTIKVRPIYKSGW